MPADVDSWYNIDQISFSLMSVETALAQLLAKQGYITIEEMMKQVLTAQPDSYYRSVKQLNSDFVTAPEISQLFGEIIALWAIEKWQTLGSPSSFSLCEFGAGQGKLLNDFLRVAKLVPDFFASIHLFIYEVNPYFIKLQKEILAKYDLPIKWQADATHLPKGPILLIANEFFDALPIKQYIKQQNKWQERVIIRSQNGRGWQYSQIDLQEFCQAKSLEKHRQAAENSILENSPDSLKIISNLAQHLCQHSGFALLIDYGYYILPEQRLATQYNSTLQAVKNHAYCPVLSQLGQADLTAHVDFEALLDMAKQQNITQFKFSTQNEFLTKYGLLFRAGLLKKSISDQEKQLIDRQVNRLTAPNQMGELFKVLELEHR